MRAFISSVRRGLEAERDALPGLIHALGHQPIAFEQFTAQPVPSREACLKGVADADVYILLLGPYYGYRFPETNQSPTHDEWMAAKAAGKPVFVFRKEGVGVEPDQATFIQQVGDYGAGSFYATFSDVAELLTEVARAIRAHEAAPSPLTFAPLDQPLAIEWKDEWSDGQGLTREHDAVVELHIVPLDGGPIAGRTMMSAPNSLATALRAAGAVPVTAGASVHGHARAATVHVHSTAPGLGPEDARFLGARLAANGQLSLWSTLPRDQLGSILDEDDLEQTLTTNLRLTSAVNMLSGKRFGLATGLSGALGVVSRGKKTGVSRTSASMVVSPRPIRVSMDESVSTAAFDRGAEEIASYLGALLIREFESVR
ncbi:DUF4062 domain-containing protein [Isoptericola sp. NPDC056573]|uniref:DUF4062 domain-containing protein n=1 Tax=Isoptericola sp. NPDC056573 TaxID=3345868 RepID=UPI0036BDEBF9